MTHYPMHTATLASTWQGLPLFSHEQSYLEIENREAGVLFDFTTPFYDDPAPPVVPSEGILSTPELWNYEVIEFFIASEDRTEYTEIELGPYGNYLALRFKGMRQQISEGHVLRYKSYLASGHWMGTALISRDDLPLEPWCFNAYRIHGTGDQRRYLSLFPQDSTFTAPDFHQLSTFQPLVFD